MNEDLRISDYIGHIVTAIDKIFRYVEGKDFDGFSASEITQDPVVRNLEIIGEASRNILRIDPAFRELHPEFPLGRAIGMRDMLSHAYFGVRIDIVWETIQEKLPDLRQQARELRARLGP